MCKSTYAEGVTYHSPGFDAGEPRDKGEPNLMKTLKGFHKKWFVNPFQGLEKFLISLLPGVPVAGEPRAMLCNAFGVIRMRPACPPKGGTRILCFLESSKVVL